MIVRRLVGSLARDLDADHGIAGPHDRIDDALDGVSECR
jgi:hypothetical protein